MVTPREHLEALRSSLEQLPDPSNWAQVETWIARARPFIRTHYPEHLADFETATREPSWSMPFYVSGSNRWTGERFDNSAEEDARTASENARIGDAVRTRILACLDGIAALDSIRPARHDHARAANGAGVAAQPAVNLRGWFVGIDGSAGSDANAVDLRRCHEVVRALVRGILAAGGGVVTLVSGDPRNVEDDPNTANTFIWTALTEIDEVLHAQRPAGIGDGPVARTVWSPKTLSERIPSRQQPVWERLVTSGRVEVRVLPDAGHFGVTLREAQAELGQALVVLGGGKGVAHLASLYQKDGKPVVPLDPTIGSSKGDGEGALALHREALLDPARFAPDASRELHAALASLSLRRDDVDPALVAGRIVRLLETLLRSAARRLDALRLPPISVKAAFDGDGVPDVAGLARRWSDQLGAAVRPGVVEGGIGHFDVSGGSKDDVIAAAEAGALDVHVGAGGVSVQEVWAADECLYERLEAVEFNYPQPEDVYVRTINAALQETDVLVVTVTDVERKALLDRLVPLPRRRAVLSGPHGGLTVRVGRLGRYGVVHVESGMGSSGRTGATLTVSDAIRTIKPKAVIAVGIAFGANRRKHRLGDVLVAETIAPYELAKIGEQGDTHRGQPLPCGLTLHDRFKSAREGWTSPGAGRQLQVHVGLVLSGEKVIDRKAFRDNLLARYETAIGGEMEGSGVYAAASRHGVHEVILVKGVCDFADGHKNDRGQPFAARAAVAYVEHVLAKPDVLSSLGARDRGLPAARRR